MPSRMFPFRWIRPVWILLWLGLGAGPAVGQSVCGTDAEVTHALAVVDSLRNQGEFRSALSQLHQLENTHPDNVDVLTAQAFIWADLGKQADAQQRTVNFFRQSLSSAKAAVEANPDCARAHLAVAVAQGHLTQHVSARERIERSQAVKTHADRAVALDSTLAGAYHILGRWHQEAADLNALVRAIVRVVYGELPEASFEQSVANFQRALELETRTYHHLELGKTYVKMGRTDAAREQLRAVLEVPPVAPFAAEYQEEARRHLEALP